MKNEGKIKLIYLVACCVLWLLFCLWLKSGFLLIVSIILISVGIIKGYSQKPKKADTLPPIRSARESNTIKEKTSAHITPSRDSDKQF